MEEKPSSIEEIIEKEGYYVGPTSGVSMRPMLKTHRDTVVIKKKDGRLRPLDVALYKRGDAYVLHRVLSAREDGYIIRGDNCYADERVAEEQVLGVLTEFYRKKKHYLCTDEKYLKYVHRRLKTYPVRRVFVRLFRWGKRVIKKLLRWEKRGNGKEKR